MNLAMSHSIVVDWGNCTFSSATRIASLDTVVSLICEKNRAPLLHRCLNPTITLSPCCDWIQRRLFGTAWRKLCHLPHRCLGGPKTSRNSWTNPASTCIGPAPTSPSHSQQCGGSLGSFRRPTIWQIPLPRTAHWQGNCARPCPRCVQGVADCSFNVTCLCRQLA